MRSEKILKLNDIKTRNMLALLGLLLEHESLSRIELARKMNCDNATVTRVVRDLLGRGLLVSSGRTELRHGRPREQLSLNPDGRYIIGIALAPDGITGTVTDLRGRVKVREQVFFPPQRTGSFFWKRWEASLRVFFNPHSAVWRESACPPSGPAWGSCRTTPPIFRS